MRTSPLPAMAVLGCLMLGTAPAAAAGGADASAEEALKTTGVRAGLCVQLGSEDGKLTAALGRQLTDAAGQAAVIVQALSADPESVAKVRAHIQEQGLYGKVSAARWDRKRLPYADDVVNLLVAEDLPKLVAAGLDLREAARVLVPDGVLGFSGAVDADKLSAAGFAHIKASGSWTVAVKPRPKEMDDWPSYNHGSDQNLVSRDLLAGCPATRLRFRGGDSPVGLMVSAGGRIFYPVPIDNLGWNWTQAVLVARDAHNGLLLWREVIAMRPRRGS